MQKHKVQPHPEMQAGQLGIQFRTGKIAMEGATTCDSVRDLEKKLPFKWNFVVPPAGPKGFRVWGDTDQMVVSKTCKNVEAAYKWIKFRSSLEAWDTLYEKRGIRMALIANPPRLSIARSNAFREALQPLDTKMIEIALSQYTIPEPFVPRSPYSNRILFTIIPTELDNALRGKKTVAQAVKDAHDLINDALLGKK